MAPLALTSCASWPTSCCAALPGSLLVFYADNNQLQVRPDFGERVSPSASVAFHLLLTSRVYVPV